MADPASIAAGAPITCAMSPCGSPPRAARGAVRARAEKKRRRCRIAMGGTIRGSRNRPCSWSHRCGAEHADVVGRIARGAEALRQTVGDGLSAAVLHRVEDLPRCGYRAAGSSAASARSRARLARRVARSVGLTRGVDVVANCCRNAACVEQRSEGKLSSLASISSIRWPRSWTTCRTRARARGHETLGGTQALHRPRARSVEGEHWKRRGPALRAERAIEATSAIAECTEPFDARSRRSISWRLSPSTKVIRDSAPYSCTSRSHSARICPR